MTDIANSLFPPGKKGGVNVYYMTHLNKVRVETWWRGEEGVYTHHRDMDMAETAQLIANLSSASGNIKTEE